MASKNQLKKDLEEIDFSIFFNAIKNNKRLIISLTSISFLVSILISLSLKRIYQGQFQIVISEQKDTSIDFDNLNLQNLFSSSLTKNSLKTEVEILKSPSVLMPIFNYVKNNKKSNDETFFIWRKNNVTINLEPQTTILNIKYRDSDKVLIQNVLTKISSTYQKYSNLQKDRKIKNGLNYLNDQIEISQIKSKKAYSKLLKYAIENDFKTVAIGNLNNNDFLKNEKNNLSQITSLNIISSQLDKLNDPNIDDNVVLYISLSVPTIVDGKLPEKIISAEAKLASLKTFFTENDIQIKQSRNELNTLYKTLKEQTINYLFAEKDIITASLDYFSKSPETIMRFRELLRDSVREGETLNKLENEKRLLALQKAKSTEPWELITNPTVNDDPIAPRRKLIGFLGLSIGAFLGIILSILKENKKIILND